MHPNAFLKSLWRNRILDQVFVAMTFDKRFDERFEKVIKPAIEAEPFSRIALRAYRVDNSRTGDSILTDIIDGIAHSRLVLADVSVIDEGRFTQTPVRNGNVMYEVGVALACRNPSDVLLIRDDTKRFLFDVSTIPHLEIDFSDPSAAIESLREAISGRLDASNLLNDARIQMAAQTLTQDEIRILQVLSRLDPNQARDITLPNLSLVSYPDQPGLDGLIAKGCIKSVAVNAKTGAVVYALNAFGYALAKVAEETLPKFQPPEEARKAADGESERAS